MAKSIKVVLELDNKDFKKGIKGSQKAVGDLEKSGKQSFANLGTAFKAMLGAAAIQQFVSLGDEFLNMSNKLKAVTGSTAEYENAMKLVGQVAKSTRSDLGATASLFANLTVASEELGLKQTEIASITETFSKGLKISGADAGAAAGAITQFGQALASGTLRGDEFNSINETNTEFMGQLAKALGKSRGELRKLAEQGMLTADIVATATLEMEKAVNEKFGKTTATIGESFTMLKNELVTVFGEIQAKTGVFTKIAAVVLLVAENVEFLAKMFAVAFAVMVAQRIVTTALAVVQLAQAFRAAAVAGTLLQGVTGVGLVKVGIGVAAASAAIVGMNALFDDSVEGMDALGDAGKDIDLKLPGAPDQTLPEETGESESSKKLKAQEEALKVEKAQKKAATEKLNILKREATLIQDNAQKVKSMFADEEASLQNKIAQLGLENQMIGLSDRQKDNMQQIADLEAEKTEAMAAAGALLLNSDPTENLRLQQEEIARIIALYDQYIVKIKEGTSANYTAATSFGAGWNEALANFADNVNDSAQYGAKIFNTMSQGFTDSIMTFVETGKLSFKDLFKSLMTEMIKMMANKMFLAIFGAGGPAGGLFAGLFNKGGYIPAGQFGIAGEQGPEIVNGPANVTSTKDTAGLMGGSSREVVVNYNINATDAMSFKQMVASDPEFIYNVTRVGQRRIPA
tara:strand:+ start:738 stop:2798 length:2061 start_codon:yes stop_codon:yes gene_type:complete